MSRELTDEEFDIQMGALAPRLKKYAHLLVREGLGLTEGQELVVEAAVEAVSFVRDVVAAGYAEGAGHVTVVWSDEAVTRMEYENVPKDWFERVPEWRVKQMNGLAEQGAAFLWLDGDDPDGMAGVDQAKVAARRKASNTQCDVWRHGLDFGLNAWCIGGVSTRAWAQKVFPDLGPHAAVVELWEAILSVARVTDDPQSAWETHNATLEKNKRSLNRRHFDALHYVSESNGTDLVIGLSPRHIWDGGAAETQGGVRFFPNIPTEEVFTTPDRNRADGIVHSALPLVHNGSVVRDFWFRFEGGRVSDFGAAEGADVLEHILATDEGAARLGECALISKNTPIRESGLLFYNTLYDENASCHLALGMGFPECYEGGYDLSPTELEASGVNQSAQHVDFMIGTDDLDITGVTAKGEEVPVFIHGQWARE